MKLRTLVLCDDAWHPAEMVQRGLGALADARGAFEFSAPGDHWSPALMEQFSVVVVAKGNHLCATDQRPWLRPETQSAFPEFVRRGGGLFLIHGGTCYKDTPALRGVAGGAFLRHPDPCLVTVEPKAKHPLTAGVQAFTEMDEHYFMALDAGDVDVFLHSRSEHGRQPAGWTRTEGRGRVCVLTPGHKVAVWRHPQFQILLGNALRWISAFN